MTKTVISKSILLFTILFAVSYQLQAEENTAPTTKTADDIKTSFSAEELARFKEERANINKKMKAWWIQSFIGIDTNEDGIATWEEVRVRAEKWARKHDNRSAEEWIDNFKAWDSNADGFLAISEFKMSYDVWLKARLKKKAELKEKADKSEEGKSKE